jgi:Carbohydrate binding domain
MLQRSNVGAAPKGGCDVRLILCFLCAALAAFVLATGAAAATVTNGNFETGDFTGWTTWNAEGSSGDWFVYTGTSGPLSGLLIAAPPEGTYAATTDQTGTGTHILYQDVALEPGQTHTLSFTLYYKNWAGVFFSPDTLSYSGEANQQYRIDIMDPAAPVDSVDPADVFATVFRTMPGDPASKPYTPLTFALTPFAGQTVRLRFAEVDNQSNLQASVDIVQIVSTRCVVPRVLGLRLGAAKRRIRVRHCSVGRVRHVHSRRSLRGRVVAQSPRPGTVKRQGFPVKLAVGRG